MDNNKVTKTGPPEQADSTKSRKRIIPVVGLFFLAPLVGEFLLGNIPITLIWLLPILALMYGGGAVFIREITRHLNRGWPSRIYLCLAFGITEEAFVTQTLFNPDYLGIRLLDYGYIELLGIGAWWTVFVLIIHTIWSTAVPIAMAENLWPKVRNSSWLGWAGLIISGLVFISGCVVSFILQPATYRATDLQYVCAAAAVIILVVIAMIAPRFKITGWSGNNKVPSTFVMGGIALAFGSVFMLLAIMRESIPAGLNVAAMIGLLVAGSILFWNWSKRSAWSERHNTAVVGGLLITYAWYGFVQVPSIGNISSITDALGNAVFSFGAVILILIAWRRTDKNHVLAGGE